MKFRKSRLAIHMPLLLAILVLGLGVAPQSSLARSSGGGGGGKTDSIRVSKCFTNATRNLPGELLIKAASSNPLAHLFAYRRDGTYQGEVQNGGGGQYGGTVMVFLPYDPGSMVIVSSAGGRVVVPTTPFQP